MNRVLSILLIAGSFMIGGCRPQPIGDADLLCVEEGAHPFKNAARHWWTDNTVLSYAYKFGDDVAYDLDGPDQCAYNKLGGISAALFDNHENSLMIGWRYDLAGHLVLAPYYHEDGEAYYASAQCTGYTAGNANEDPDLEHVTIPPTEQFEVFWRIVDDQTVNVLVLTSTINLEYEHTFPGADFSHWREIAPWFGGPLPAPHEICLWRYAISAGDQ